MGSPPRHTLGYHSRRMLTATLRFYAALNDCLPPEHRQRTYPWCFHGSPAVKDVIESQGVPHVEVGLILANNEPVDFLYRLRDGDRVAVYPAFANLDVSSVQRVGVQPLADTAFVADEHLGKLARLLRLLGFDTCYAKGMDDAEIAAQAARQGWIVLTRDRGLLKRARVEHGYWVRSTDPVEQAQEVVRRYNLEQHAKPFSLCLQCGGSLLPVDKERVLPRVPPRVRAWRDEYLLCSRCNKLYWRGTHHARLSATVRRILGRD